MEQFSWSIDDEGQFSLVKLATDDVIVFAPGAGCAPERITDEMATVVSGYVNVWRQEEQINQTFYEVYLEATLYFEQDESKITFDGLSS